jgi:V/A-type H+-transporting ATPase subunit K
MELGLILAILGAALVISLGGIGSAIGVSLPGQAAAGVMTEDPEKFGRMIPLISIPGTQGFYSLLLGFLVINKIGLLGEKIKAVSTSQGLELVSICLLVGLVECISAIYQGKVAVSSVGLVAKKPDETGKALLIPIFVEIYAILGLVAGFLLLQGVKI